MAKQFTEYIGNTPTSNSLMDGLLYNRVYATNSDKEFTYSLRGLWESTISGKLHSTVNWTDYQKAAMLMRQAHIWGNITIFVFNRLMLAKAVAARADRLIILCSKKWETL